ncbi:Uncharacterised protein [Mycobacteroides abscessus subsp. bolletii]|nr:Uncharacterised protein [Mycobacteroides abscessus subsp. bolletii]SKT76430.1 Uncharacterised protein [Mycobacteroides abscessus subsp. bolletii]SLD34887.1 Uncharacterised protein [Mycobacteroides abscessus subsp. bolletii]SLF79879.1 Uncharacterised protein [Mycobacteroides abscessus subsp. bolletii]
MTTPRVWQSPNDVPDGVVVTDAEELALFKWVNGVRYMDRGRHIVWDEGESVEDSPNTWLELCGPFTEVVEAK